MKKLLAIDLGTKSMGVAITDALLIAAHGYENFNFEFGNYKKAREHLIEILKKENINELAIGYPLHMSGEVSERAMSCIRFKDDLLLEMPELEITMVDERMTTIIANKRMLSAGLSANKRKKVIDQQSAVVILENYMQQRKNKI